MEGFVMTTGEMLFLGLAICAMALFAVVLAHQVSRSKKDEDW